MFRIDLHTHTSYGSPCGYMTPAELIRRAKLVGLDGVCITEHNQLWDDEALEKLRREHDFLVIGGVEVDTDYGDILAFGLHEPVFDVYHAEELAELADQAGGVMVAAHPFRGLARMIADSSESEFSLERASQRPVFQFVDAVEVCNGMANPAEIDLATRVSRYLKLKATAGSDAHAILQVGHCLTIFKNKISNEQDLITEIKQGRCWVADWRSHLLPPLWK